MSMVPLTVITTHKSKQLNRLMVRWRLLPCRAAIPGLCHTPPLPSMGDMLDSVLLDPGHGDGAIVARLAAALVLARDRLTLVPSVELRPESMQQRGKECQ